MLTKNVMTKDMKVGTIVLVKSGNTFSGNVTITPQTVSGITSQGKMREVSFESGMVCRFKEHTLHTLACN